MVFKEDIVEQEMTQEQLGEEREACVEEMKGNEEQQHPLDQVENNYYKVYLSFSHDAVYTYGEYISIIIEYVFII